MAAKFVVLFACVALACAGRVPRETAAPLADLQKHAEEFQKTIVEQLGSLSSATHTEEFHKALKDGSNTVLQQLSTLSSNLQAVIADASGKTRQVLEQGQVQVQKAVQDLQNNHQDVHQNAEKLRSTLSDAVASAVQATQNLAKEFGTKVESTNEQLAPQIKSAYDDFVKNVQAVQKNLQETINKKQ